MKISIIIPNKDNCSKLSRCIESIKESRFKDYEIIIVDDGSSTKEIRNFYQRIKSSNLEILFNKNNMGPSYSRNKGADYAKGDVLLFIDSDCYIFPNTLEIINDFFRKNKEISCIGGTYAMLSPSGSFFDNFQSLIVHYFETKKKYAPYLAGHCFAIKKDLFNKTKGFIIGRYIGRKPNVEDVVFSFQLKEMREKLIILSYLLVKHDSGYNLFKSIKNAFNKSFIWMKLSAKLKVIGKDLGAGGKELKISIILLFLFLLSLLFGFFYPLTLVAGVLFLSLNVVNLYPMIKLSIKKNLFFGFAFYFYFTFVYSLFVGIGGLLGLLDYFILGNKKL